jgi:hypothetical protein
MDGPGGQPPDPPVDPRWSADRRWPQLPAPTSIDAWRPGRRQAEEPVSVPPPPPSGAVPLGDDEDEDLMVRPFLLTGGRTSVTQEGLRVESLIQANEGVQVHSLRFESRQIYDLCDEPNSIAEIAAELQMPLGVARVLVSDLIAEGFVTFVQHKSLSVQLLERIRDGVRAL